MGRPLNPVLSRELTQRMRGPRAAIMLTIYLSILGLIVVLVYRAESSTGSSPYGGSPIVQIASVGQGLFEWTLLFTLLLVLFLVPGFTAGAIAGERERQTLLPMQVTLLRPSSIVFGKIAASVVFTLLLVVATLPLLTLAYLIGGITVGDLAKGLAMVIFTALVLAAISVACSTFMRRVQTATVLAYGIVLLIAGGTLIGFVVAREIDQSRGFDVADPPEEIVALNPVAALADLVGDDPLASPPFFGGGPVFFNGSSQADAPLSGIRDLLVPDVFFEGDFAAFEEPRPAVAFDEFGRPATNLPGGGFPLWGKYVVASGVLAAAALIGSSRRLRTPAKTER